MYRATGPGQIEIIVEDKTSGILEALLYNFDFDDFADRKFRPLKIEHTNFLSSYVIPLLDNNRGNIWLQGSASQIGREDWNMNLSMVRAGQVQAFLLDRNIGLEQVEANAVGEKLAASHARDDPRDRGVYLWVRPRPADPLPLPKKVPPRPKASAGKLGKLYIYDKSSKIDRSQASGRFSDKEVTTIAVNNGLSQLKTEFDALSNTNRTFNRVLFQTHGGSGRIWFGNERLDKSVLKTTFNNYTSLFPHKTRIYFDGCNVAEGGDGTDFLLAAGNVFLVMGGGDVFGWVNVGAGMPGWLPFIGGHTLHFGGGNNLKRIRFYPGGSPNFPHSWIPAR